MGWEKPPGRAYLRGMQFVVEHIGLPARDPHALADWYVRALGASLVDAGGKTPPLFVRLPGGLMLEIYSATSSAPETSDNALAGFRHLALRVASIEVASAELKQRGVKFTDPVKPAAGGGRVLFFSDAEGNLLHLVERTADTVFH